MTLSRINPSTFRHSFKILYLDLKLALSTELTYRWQIFMWVLSDLIQPFLLASIWSAAVNVSNSSVSSGQMISYYLGVTVVLKLTQDWSMTIVTDSIARGDFYKYLIRPYNYLAEMMGISIALRILRIAILIPFLIIFYLLAGDMLLYDLSWFNMLLFIMAVVGGFILSFIIGNTFSLISFHIKQLTGIKALYVNLISVLSGEYIPFALLAIGPALLFDLQPFRYLLSFPVEILMGILYEKEVVLGFFMLILWIGVFSLGYIYLYKVSIKRYEAEGI